MLIEPILLKCPQCHHVYQHYTSLSGTIHESISYTDGKTDVISGMISFDPLLVKCRHCSALFLFETAMQAVDEEADKPEPGPAEDLDFEQYHPDIGDFAKALDQIKDLSKEQERDLRFQLWWEINDLIRYESGIGERRSLWMDFVNYLYKPFRNCKKLHRNYPQYLKWKNLKNENLLKLIPLLHPENNVEDSCILVEIYRETKAFSKAKEELQKLPDGRLKSFKKLQHKLIAQRNAFAMKIS